MSGLDQDYQVKPDTKLSTLLNTAWELWKPIVAAPEIQTVTFSVGADSEDEFRQRSPIHRDILHLFSMWVDTTDNVMRSIIPGGVSVLELHHYVNDRPQSPLAIQMSTIALTGKTETASRSWRSRCFCTGHFISTKKSPAGPQARQSDW